MIKIKIKVFYGPCWENGRQIEWDFLELCLMVTLDVQLFKWLHGMKSCSTNKCAYR